MTYEIHMDSKEASRYDGASARTYFKEIEPLYNIVRQPAHPRHLSAGCISSISFFFGK